MRIQKVPVTSMEKGAFCPLSVVHTDCLAYRMQAQRHCSRDREGDTRKRGGPTGYYSMADRVQGEESGSLGD